MSDANPTSGLFPWQPGAEYRADREEIDPAILRVLASGKYILGTEGEAFEKEFASWLGAADVAGVANGTDALALALRACGIGPGDIVATVSHTAVATVAAIEQAGAEPLLLDIDPATFTMDPAHLEEELQNDTAARIKAVVPVHLYGHPADMNAILPLARHYGAQVIEDCAQAHGAMLDGKMAGTFGDAATFSFYPTKNLGATGDGGAVAASDATIVSRVRTLRQYGWRYRYVSEVPGMNSRLDELQAAILRVKLRKLTARNARRHEIAMLYDEGLKNCGLNLPKIAPGVRHAWHQYVVRAPGRGRWIDCMEQAGIPHAIHYPLPVHMQPAYEGRVRIAKSGLPATGEIARDILSLPMHALLPDEGVARVVEVLNNAK